MTQGLYVGKLVEPGRAAPGTRVKLPPSALLNCFHIVGPSGSGKTALAAAGREGESGALTSGDNSRLESWDIPPLPGGVKVSATTSSGFCEP